MNFEDLIRCAKANDKGAMERLLVMYQPLLMKESIVDGIFDEDLYQELSIVFIHCVRQFKI